MEKTTMNIEFDRRHAFLIDPDGQPRAISPHRLDRLWLGDPDAAMPELAGQRVRAAMLHVERFTSPPRVVVEHYPVLIFAGDGQLDHEAHRAQLHADVDELERSGYADSPAGETETEWRPDPVTRGRLVAATNVYRRSSRARPLPCVAEERRPHTIYGRIIGRALAA